MKSLLLIVLFVFLLSLTYPVFSQDVELGFKLGPNIGLITGGGYTEFVEGLDDQAEGSTGMRIGVSAGVFFSIGFFDFLAVQYELFFSNVGGSYEYEDITVQMDPIPGEMNVSVLEIPILLKPRFLLSAGVMYFLLGPEVIIILGPSRVREDREAGVSVGGFVTDNDLLFGMVAGLGYVYPIGPGYALLEVRYMRSLTSFEDYDSFDLNAINIMLGYELTLELSAE